MSQRGAGNEVYSGLSVPMQCIAPSLLYPMQVALVVEAT